MAGSQPSSGDDVTKENSPTYNLDSFVMEVDMCPDRKVGPQKPTPDLPPVPTAETAARAQEPLRWDPVLVTPGPRPATPKLPLQAFVYVPGNSLAECVGSVGRGQAGYHLVESPLIDDLVDHASGLALVKQLNAHRGISPLQSHCMLIGALQGWDSWGADPDNYTPWDIAKLP